jgi:hypothetical protein
MICWSPVALVTANYVGTFCICVVVFHNNKEDAIRMQNDKFSSFAQFVVSRLVLCFVSWWTFAAFVFKITKNRELDCQ